MGLNQSAIKEIVSPVNNLITHVFGSCDCTIQSNNCNMHWRTISQHDLNRIERIDSRASLKSSVVSESDNDIDESKA